MPQDRFYRCVSHPGELEQFRGERIIRSSNPRGGGRTWFTNQRLRDAAEAEMVLALPNRPRYVVGPVPEDEMPFFDVCCARVVDPAYGNPGGGVEFCTTQQVEVFGWYSFESNAWEPLE